MPVSLYQRAAGFSRSPTRSIYGIHAAGCGAARSFSRSLSGLIRSLVHAKTSVTVHSTRNLKINLERLTISSRIPSDFSPPNSRTLPIILSREDSEPPARGGEKPQASNRVVGRVSGKPSRPPHCVFDEADR